MKSIASSYSPPASPSPPHSRSLPLEEYGTDRTPEKSMSLSKTPAKKQTPFGSSNHVKKTPPSSGNFQRVLDLESDDGASDDEDYSSFARKTLLERFEDTYRALKDKPAEVDDELTYANDGSDEDSTTELTSSVSATRSQPTYHHVLSRAPPGSCITVTGSNGKRVYLRCRAAAVSNSAARSYSRFQLLSVSFTELKATVEEEVSPFNLQE